MFLNCSINNLGIKYFFVKSCTKIYFILQNFLKGGGIKIPLSYNKMYSNRLLSIVILGSEMNYLLYFVKQNEMFKNSGHMNHFLNIKMK